MSYTKDTGDDGPEWLRKLPKISSQSRSMAKSASSGDDEGKVPPGMLPSTENEGFLFEKAEDAKKGSLASSVGWRKKKKREDGVGPGGPISQSAIYPEREKDSEIAISSTTSPSPQDSDPPSPTTPHPAYFRGRDPEKAVPEPQAPKRKASPTRSVRSQIEVYEEGSQWIIEDKDGEVLAVTPARNSHDIEQGIPEPQQVESRPDSGPTQDSFWTFSGLKSRFNSFITEEKEKRKENSERTRKQSTAYQYGHTVIVEDEDGEVVKRYDISSQDRDTSGHDFVSQSMRYMRVGGFTKGHVDSRLPLSASNEPPATGLGPHRQRKQTLANLQQEEDDKNVRFRIEGEEGGRMDKEELIRAITQRTARHEHSTTSEHVKEMSKKASEKLVPKLDSRRQYSRPPIPAEAGASGGGGGGGGRDLEQSDTAKAGTRSGSEYPTGPTNPHSSPTVAVTAAADEAIIVPGPSSPIATATLLSPLDHRGVSPRPLSRDSHRSHRSQGSQRQSMTMEGEPMETDAEKRRREAALGMNDDHENDSEDDNTERALPAAQKRGIRWVDSPPKD